MSKPAPRDVTITRIFDAPRELVFNAWTNADLVQQWWGPTYFTNPVCEVDARPGGEMLIHMRAPDGTVFPDKCVFHEVTPPKRLVFTSNALDDDQGNPMLVVRITVDFEEVHQKTKLTLHAEVVRATPEAEQALAGMKEGWSQSLEKLAGLLIKA